jgi:hypothetical protein
LARIRHVLVIFKKYININYLILSNTRIGTYRCQTQFFVSFGGSDLTLVTPSTLKGVTIFFPREYNCIMCSIYYRGMDECDVSSLACVVSSRHPLLWMFRYPYVTRPFINCKLQIYTNNTTRTHTTKDERKIIIFSIQYLYSLSCDLLALILCE